MRIETQVRTGFAVALLLVVVAYGLAWSEANKATAAMAEARHAHRVLERLSALLSHVGTAETAQRGFLVTGEPACLLPYDDARSDARANLDELIRLLEDDPQVLAHVRAMGPLVTERLARLDQAIRLQGDVGVEAAQTFASTLRGHELMQAIRAHARAARALEATTLGRREDALERSARRTSLGILAVAAFGVLGLAAALVVVERGLAERRAAHEAAAALASLVTSSDDAIIGNDLDGTIVSWNAGAERLYGYTAAEACGRNVTMLAPPGRSDEIPAILERIRRGERVDHVETERLRKDGRVVAVSIAVSPVVDAAGRVTAAATIARDVTSKRREEVARTDVVEELRAALAGVRTLRGLLPTCTWCKKIRDEAGCWQPMEIYVQQRSEAEFTHGICSECSGRLRAGTLWPRGCSRPRSNAWASAARRRTWPSSSPTARRSPAASASPSSVSGSTSPSTRSCSPSPAISPCSARARSRV